MKTNYLLKDGRLGVRIRKPLRAFVNAKEHKTDYINDLIAKDATSALKQGIENEFKYGDGTGNTTDYVKVSEHVFRNPKAPK